MKKQKKQLRCEEYLRILKEHPLIVVIHYNNLVSNYTRIEQAKELLKDKLNLAKQSMSKPVNSLVGIKIIKNTLVKHTLESTAYTNMSHLFAGPTLVLYSTQTSPGIVHLILQWIQNQPHLQVIGAKYENSLVSLDDLMQITKLPETQQESVSQITTMLNGYIAGVTNTISIANADIYATLRIHTNNKHIE